MPHYQFNVRSETEHVGFQGKALPDLDAARRESFKLLIHIVENYGAETWINSAWRVELTDEVGLILFTLNFSAIEAPSLAG